MTLRLNRMGSTWNRNERININDNWDMIEQNFNGVVGETVKQAYDEIIDTVRQESIWNWKDPVEKYDDIEATYPEPNIGDTTIVLDDGDKTGNVYRYKDGEWQFVFKINPDIYLQLQNELNQTNNNLMQLQQDFMSQLADIAIFPEMFGAKGDGISDDTSALQAAFDYVIQNKGKLRLTGEYLVNPKVMEDGSKVCLLIYQDNQDNATHVWGDGGEIEFAKGSSIFTTSTEECSLIRIKASNTKIINPTLQGVKDKTVLLEFSRKNKLDNTEVDFIVFNTIKNAKFKSCKVAIQMEGQSFYNTFDGMIFINCRRLIYLKESEYQITTGIRNSNVNRNNFLNITANVSNNEGIVIEYGDTNKFVNVNFEGLTDYCIKLINIQDTKPGMWYTENNSFTNVTFEACAKQIYNSGLATQFFNVNYSPNNCTFVRLPRNLQGSMDDAYSPSIYHSLVVNTEDTYRLNKKWSSVITSAGGLYARNFADYDDETTVVEGNFDFTEEQCTNISNLTFNSASTKPLYKSVGRILHYLCRCSFMVTDVTKPIVLPLPRAPRSNYYVWGNIFNTTKTVVVEDTITRICYVAFAEIGETGIIIKPPQRYELVDGVLTLKKEWTANTQVLCIEIDYFI